jgi:diguanylate cyclase (GGDEF)-like protein
MSDAKNNLPDILFVDDSKTARKTAEKILSNLYIVHEAVNGKDAWEQIEKHPDFAVVFADIEMPVMNGLQLLANIRTSPDRRIAHKPVIMITGHSDSHAAMRAVFEMGATGFVSKPFSDIDLLSCACSYITLNRRLNYLEEELGIDRQSGLYTFSRFEEEGIKALSLALRHKLELSLVFVELKALSEIGASHSNKIASKLVVEVGQRMQKHLRTEEFFARISASRFAILLPATNSYNTVIPITRLRDMIKSMTFIVNNNEIHVDIAAGISSIGENSRTLDFKEFCSRSEIALQNALESDSENISIHYDESDHFMEAEKKVRYDKVLTKSLPYIIEGDFHKVTDENLAHVISIFKPLMKYAAIKTGTS